MAVKVICSICDEFIKDAKEFQSLTGKETCVRCGKRIDDIFHHMDKSLKDFDAKVAKMHNDAKEIYSQLGKAYSRFTNDAASLRTTMTAELDRMKQDIIK